MAGAMDHNEQTPEDEPRTVTLSGDDLRSAARLLSKIVPEKMAPLERVLLADRTEGSAPPGDRAAQDRFALIALAKQTFLERRRRSNFFASDMLAGEPGWDMLLALYVNHLSGERLTISRLLRFAGAPDTTALRWLNYLEDRGLIVREKHPNDARSVLIHLTDKARGALDMYFSETLKART